MKHAWCLLLVALGAGCEAAKDGPPARGVGLALTSTYESSAVEQFDVDAPARGATPILVADGDAVLRRLGDGAVVVNRGQADNLQLLDARFALTAQIALGGCGPHDALALPDGRIAVSCYEDDALRVVDASTRAVSEVALADLADADGLPELDQLALAGGKLFVSVQNLDRDAGFVASGDARLAVLDAVSLARLGEWPLPCENPFTPMGVLGDELVVGCADFFAPTASSLVAVRVDTGAARVLVDGARLGGSPTSLRADGQGGRVLVTVAVATADDPFETLEMRVLGVDAAGGVELLHRADGFVLSGLALDATGRVLVGDRSEARVGVWILPAAVRIPTELPPVDIELY